MEYKKPIKIKFKNAIILIELLMLVTMVTICIVADNRTKSDDLISVENQLSNSTLEQKTAENENSNIMNTNTTLDVKNVQANKNIVLYKGIEIDNKVGIQNLSDMKLTDENKSKYNVQYYNYEDGKYINETKGAFGEETVEGYSAVSNVKKIAMTKKYNAIPREFKTLSELPKELMDMADYSSVNINEIDLDGDGKKEHIVCYTHNTSGDDYDDEEMEASSGIILFDNNYKKISDLVTLDNGFWGNKKSENTKIFLSLKDIDYIDIDEDGIMEIIIKVPTYEGTKISVLKYKDGILNGEKNLKASVLP